MGVIGRRSESSTPQLVSQTISVSMVQVLHKTHINGQIVQKREGVQIERVLRLNREKLSEYIHTNNFIAIGVSTGSPEDSKTPNN